MTRPAEISAHRPQRHVRLAGAVAFLTGLAIALQGRVNGELGEVTQHGVLAAAINFSVGLAALALIVFLRPEGRRAFLSLPGHVRDGALPWWTLLGGLAGACYVSAQSITVASLGVALFTISTVAGTTGLSLGVDHWGIGPGGVVAISGLRIVAAVTATVAVAVAAWGSGGANASGWTTVGYVGLSVFAGAVVAFQPALNGRIAATTGQPTVAAMVNFIVGLLLLLLLVAVQELTQGGVFSSLPDLGTHWWLYCGGFFGLAFVVGSAWAVRSLGVLLLTLVVLAGTLLGAVLVDLLLPTSGETFTVNVALGVLMTFAAAALASVRPGRKVSWQDSGS